MHMSSENDETFDIIAFMIHAILFIIMVFFAFVNTSLLENQTYTDMLYILLSTLLIHGGYSLGKRRG